MAGDDGQDSYRSQSVNVSAVGKFIRQVSVVVCALTRAIRDNWLSDYEEGTVNTGTVNKGVEFPYKYLPHLTGGTKYVS